MSAKPECACPVDKAYLVQKPQNGQIYLRLQKACEHRTIVEHFGSLDALVKDNAATARARTACERWNVPLQRLYDRLVKERPPKAEPDPEGESDGDDCPDLDRGTRTEAEFAKTERLTIKEKRISMLTRSRSDLWDPEQPIGGKLTTREKARRRQALADALKRKDGNDR